MFNEEYGIGRSFMYMTANTLTIDQKGPEIYKSSVPIYICFMVLRRVLKILPIVLILDEIHINSLITIFNL